MNEDDLKNIENKSGYLRNNMQDKAQNMKQWITETQFNELTDEKKVIWLDWVKEHGYTFAKIYPHIKNDGWTTLGFPSIGEMIEFLHEYYPINITDAKEWYVDIWTKPQNINKPLSGYKYMKEYHNIELCDALWEAVKSVLNT